MKEALLTAILNLLALISSLKGEKARQQSRAAVADYLNGRIKVGDREQYLELFDELFDLALLTEPAERKSRAWQLCDNLISSLPRQEQLLVALNLMGILQQDSDDQPNTLQTVFAAALDLDGELLTNFQTLIGSAQDYAHLNANFLVLDHGQVPAHAQCRRLYRPDFKANWTLLEHADTDSLFLTTNATQLNIDGHPIIPGRCYLLAPGAMLKDGFGGVCYYAEIQQALSGSDQKPSIEYIADRVNFRFPNSDNGLHNFICHETSGKLIGVMGGSGAGKSTLLSILSGTLPPNSGQITINGIDLYGKQRDLLEGSIGLVPQDDLLFEDLSVADNLLFNARLCLPHLNEPELNQRVKQTLSDLNQLEIADLKVGSPLQKSISGGQRKRLNIALELIREPTILFADEPTSGLSSADSLNVMSLLKQQALGGRLVIAVIHQPASEAFKLLDQLWILDKGGRPVFIGHPLEAISYFQRAVGLAGADQSICPSCGNVDPGQIFEMLEMRAIDQRGQKTDQRQLDPEEWHQRYLQQAESKPTPKTEPTPITEAAPKPGYWQQFGVFFQRTLKARFANHSYLAINFIQAPLLALLLGWLTHHSSSEGYLFIDNENIPGYFFMSVIVAAFLGLSLSAEEIVRDRSILKRESFLGLSWLAYINAKMTYLKLWVGVQMLIFILITHYILQIEGLFWQSWLLLYGTAITAILIGLNISASFRSVVAIYILLPLLLIPQMMLGGSVIPFNKLISGDAPTQNVPWYANIVPARWSYEALLVEQFSSNRYNQARWQAKCAVKQFDIVLDDRIPELRSIADKLYIATKNGATEPERKLIKILNFEFNRLNETQPRTDSIPQFSANIPFTSEQLSLARDYLDQAEEKFLEQRDQAFELESDLESDIEAKLDQDAIEKLRKAHSNDAINLIAFYGLSVEPIRRGEDRIVQLSAPVCKPAESDGLMAHFAAGHKQLGPYSIPTFWANLIVLALIAFVLYFALAIQLLPRLLGSAHKQ